MLDKIFHTNQTISFFVSVIIFICALIWYFKSPKHRLWAIGTLTAIAHWVIFYLYLFIAGVEDLQDPAVMVWSTTRNLHLLIALAVYWFFKARGAKFDT